MTEDQQVIERIRADHPYPWQQVHYPNGLIRMIDAKGCEVSIFAITGLCVAASQEYAARAPVA